MKSSYIKGLIISTFLYYFTNYCNAWITIEKKPSNFPQYSYTISGKQLNSSGKIKHHIDSTSQEESFSKQRYNNFGAPYGGLNETIVNKNQFNSYNQWQYNKQFGNNVEAQRPNNRRYYHNNFRPYGYSHNRFKQKFRTNRYQPNNFRRHINRNYNKNNFRPDSCYYGPDNVLKCDVTIYFKRYETAQNFSQQPGQNGRSNYFESLLLPNSRDKTHPDDALSKPELVAPKKIRQTRKPRVQTKAKTRLKKFASPSDIESKPVGAKRGNRKNQPTTEPKASQTETQPEFFEFDYESQFEQSTITPEEIDRTRKSRSKLTALVDNMQAEPKPTARKKIGRTRKPKTQSIVESKISITDTHSDPYKSGEDSQPEPETIAPETSYATNQQGAQSKASEREAQSDTYQADEDAQSEPETTVTKRIYRTRKPRVQSPPDTSITETNKEIEKKNISTAYAVFICIVMAIVYLWLRVPSNKT